jgi:hypothetical protein
LDGVAVPLNHLRKVRTVSAARHPQRRANAPKKLFLKSVLFEQ